MPGDWNGDAIDTIAAKTGSTWDLRNTNTAGAPDLGVRLRYGRPTCPSAVWRLP